MGITDFKDGEILSYKRKIHENGLDEYYVKYLKKDNKVAYKNRWLLYEKNSGGKIKKIDDWQTICDIDYSNFDGVEITLKKYGQ